MSPLSYQKKIDITERDLQRWTAEAWDAILAANNPPKLFRRAGQIVRLERDETGGVVVREVTESRMRNRLARVARWVKHDVGGVEYAVLPPTDVVKDVLASPAPKLPILERLVEVPVFDSDGALLSGWGYHLNARLFHLPRSGFRVPAISLQPTADEIETARRLIVEELLGDFPFAGPAELAHAVAALLLPFVRNLIARPTPIHLIEKPAPGTGATLLVAVLTTVACGQPAPTMSEGKDEDEWRRRIFAKLIGGDQVVLIDNIKRRIESAAFAAAVTSDTFEDRRIRTSEIGRAPVRCLWVVTGNNPDLSPDLIRRSIRIRLDARVDRPSLRTGFRHPELQAWVSEHRAELVWAALTLIQSWVAAGWVPGKKSLGMFERWAAVMGGILDHAGIPGFLGNLDEFYGSEDAESSIWAGFVESWFALHGEAEVTAADLLLLAGDSDLIEGQGDGRKIVFGRNLARMKDRQFNRLRIVHVGTRKGSQVWKVVRVEEAKQGG